MKSESPMALGSSFTVLASLTTMTVLTSVKAWICTVSYCILDRGGRRYVKNCARNRCRGKVLAIVARINANHRLSILALENSFNIRVFYLLVLFGFKF